MAKKTSKNTSLIIISLFTLILIILLLFTIARTTGFADEIFKSKAESKLSDSKVTEDLEKLDSNPEEIKEINNSEVKTETIVEKEPEEKPIEKIIESEVIEVLQTEFKIDEKELAKQKQLLELSSKDNITIEYSYEKPVMSKDSENKDIVTISKLNNLNKPGEPEVPFEVVMIMLPADKDVDKITVIPDNKIDIKGTYDIKTGDWQVPISQTEKIDILELEKNKTIFNKYPNSYYSNPSTQIKKGYKFVIFNLYPVEYQQKKQKLFYYQKFTVVVTLKPGDVPKSFRASNIEDKKEIQNWVISQNSNLRAENLTYEKYQEISRAVTDKTNLSALYTYTRESKQKTNGRNQPNIPDTVSYKYIIVTKRQFGPSFQPLIIWKSHRPNNPITAKIFYMEDILVDPRFSCTGEYNWGDGCGSLNQFNDDAAKLRNFIRFAYTTYDTEYVLLGGDADYQNLGPGTETEDIIVPVRYIFSTSSYLQILSDVYFSNLDGSFDSDNDGDFIFYNITENPTMDYLPDVAVGRAPFDNSTEIANWINKVITSEQVVNNTDLNYLFFGEYFGPVRPFMGPSSLDSIINGSHEIGGIDTVGFSVINPSNIYRLYEDNHNYNPPNFGYSVAEITNEINLRKPYIINHSGHGNVTYFMKFNSYSLNELFAISTNAFFVYSTACLVGAIDNFNGETTDTTDSISEQFLGNPNGPSGLIVNSAIGIGTRFGDIFWDKAFKNYPKNQGGVLNLAKENYYLLGDYFANHEYLSKNLLGDPETSFALPTVGDKLIVNLLGNSLESIYYQEDLNLNIEIINLTNELQSNLTLSIYLDNELINNQDIVLNPGTNHINYLLSHNLYNSAGNKTVRVVIDSIAGDANYNNTSIKNVFIYNFEGGSENTIIINNQLIDCNINGFQNILGITGNILASKLDIIIMGSDITIKNCNFELYPSSLEDGYPPELKIVDSNNVVIEYNLFKHTDIYFESTTANVNFNNNAFYTYISPAFLGWSNRLFIESNNVTIYKNRFISFTDFLADCNPAINIQNTHNIIINNNYFNNSIYSYSMGTIFINNSNNIDLKFNTFIPHNSTYFNTAIFSTNSENLQIFKNNIKNQGVFLQQVIDANLQYNNICDNLSFDLYVNTNCEDSNTFISNFIKNKIDSIHLEGLQNCPELLPQYGINYCYCNEIFSPGGVGCIPDPNYQNTLEMEN